MTIRPYGLLVLPMRTNIPCSWISRTYKAVFKWNLTEFTQSMNSANKAAEVTGNGGMVVKLLNSRSSA
jgi:hypothetical protein